MTSFHALCSLNYSYNPFIAELFGALHNALESFYQITHTVYLLETMYKIVTYKLGKPKTFLD